jgi:hypothetical protein
MADGTTFSYDVAHDVSSGTLSHIHTAPGAISGPVTAALTPFSTHMTGTVTLTSQNVTDLQSGRLYVNVHSTTFPGGEIRGQILRPGETLFNSLMDGTNEVPPVTTNGTGTFALILSADKSSVHGEGAATGLSSPANASHIHVGAAGVSGGVWHAIAYSDNGTDAGLSLATTSINATDLTNLTTSMWYTNVHTTNHPGGEIRGQLMQQ